jgi:ribonuclease D
MNRDIAIISDAASLVELCRELAAAPWLAIDTEFMREKSYYPRLCLIQVATPQQLACIDPEAVEDLSPFVALLLDPDIIKVLHAASQDLEVLLPLCGQVPAPIFDTQLAAMLCGFGDQIGYAALVERMTGVVLDKSQTRTDWSQRPLSHEQLVYAADDVLYLAQIYPQMCDELQRRGRTNWLDEDFAELTHLSRYQPPISESWQRVRGAQRLHGISLVILQRLAAWREEVAQQADRPRRWLMRDEVLLDLAVQQPRSLEQLMRVRGLESGIVSRYGALWLSIIHDARLLPASALPQEGAVHRLEDAQEALVDLMMVVLRCQALAEGISPAAIASRRDVVAWLLDRSQQPPFCHGWRFALAGAAMMACLNGRQGVVAEQGKIRLLVD